MDNLDVATTRNTSEVNAMRKKSTPVITVSNETFVIFGDCPIPPDEGASK